MTAQLTDQPNAPWCTTADVLALPAFAELDDQARSVLDELCLVASCWLWRATARQFSGPATATVRPVQICFAQSFSSYPLTYASAMSFDSRSGTYGGYYGMRGEGAFERELGHWPVRSIDQVVIDGAILAPSAYRLDDARWLVRIDGSDWPYWQDWKKPSGPAAALDQTNTWEVTLTFGADPPPDGKLAAEVLAGELALSMTDASSCRLPGTIQSITRQGESMFFMDPSTLLAGDKWGIKEIDLFVHQINPNNLTISPMVLSPDIPRAVRRVGTTPGS